MVCIYGTKRRRTKANRHTTITSFAEAGETVVIADDDEPTVHIEILPPVCTENSNPDVMMVKPAEDRVRTNDSDLLDRTKNRRILVQRPMRSDGVVVSGIGN